MVDHHTSAGWLRLQPHPKQWPIILVRVQHNNERRLVLDLRQKRLEEGPHAAAGFAGNHHVQPHVPGVRQHRQQWRKRHVSHQVQVVNDEEDVGPGPPGAVF